MHCRGIEASGLRVKREDLLAGVKELWVGREEDEMGWRRGRNSIAKKREEDPPQCATHDVGAR